MDFKNKRVLVIGLGKSGQAVIDALHKRGAQISAYDKKTRMELGHLAESLENLQIDLFAGVYPEISNEQFDLLVVSPGVPLDFEPIKKAYLEKIPIIGELELAYRLKKPSVNLYAITGTNGKTTATALLEHILLNDGQNAFAGGNIGIPLLELIEKMDEGVIALEVSSFQLETIRDFKAEIAAILNITPDHLDRHKNMENYTKIKFNIFNNQESSDYALINYDEEKLRFLADKITSNLLFFSSKSELKNGLYIKGQEVIYSYNIEPEIICLLSDISLKGDHNYENVLCAIGIALLAGVKKEIIKQAIQSFKGVRHRLEEVALHEEVLYINDSKATNPDSTIKALQAFNSNIILIAGGKNKGSDFSLLSSIIYEKVKYLILIGEAKELIRKTVIAQGFENIYEVGELEAAVLKAKELSVAGDIILLSPACASWDMFENYEQRGDLFCQIVKSFQPIN